MGGYYYLNFGDLSEEAQEEMLETAKEELEEGKGRKKIEKEAKDMNIDYDTFLQERAERHIYSFDFVFNV